MSEKIQTSVGKAAVSISKPAGEIEKLAILLPGYLDSKDYPHLTALQESLAAEGYLAVSVDPIGTWESGKAIRKYTMTNVIATVEEIIKHFQSAYSVKQVVLLGHSLGGLISIMVASQNTFVSAVVAIMPPHMFSRPEKREDELNWKMKGYRISKRDVPGEPDKMIEFEVPYLLVKDSQKYDALTVLKGIHIPILFIGGELDGLFSPQKIEMIYKAANEPKEMEIISGATHDYRKDPSAIKRVNEKIISFLKSKRDQLGLNNFSVARVISEHKEAYRVKNEKGEYLAKITGKQMFQAQSREDYPAVGDWVAITVLDNEHAVIERVLPRKTIIKKKSGNKNKAGAKSETQVIATNIDVAFVVESVDRDFNLNRFERYFAIATSGGVTPAIILNKVDLLSKEELNEKVTQLKNRFPDIDIIPTSTTSNEGLDALKNYIAKDKTYCFLGSSGVGKSSLINKLIGESIIKTGDISSYSGRGKHTTTGRQMYYLKNGGIVIDNPGIREVGVIDAGQGIDTFFDEITALAEQCKFTDCTHTHEPGCEVIKAVKAGKLDKERYSNYLNLKNEADFYDLTDVEKREKDRQFGKFIKRAKKDLKNLGHKE